jgi:hypothetical protein
MALIDDVRLTCSELAPHGWRELLLGVTGGELDIASGDLAFELSKPLEYIDRRVEGFDDFADEGQRGIEPGIPARSLLLHALASPGVVRLADRELGAFPTLKQIEAVENYVYGVEPPTLAELLARRSLGRIAIVVFATEYRTVLRTPHRRHADLCFSRTGLARVGTAAAHYDPKTRQFEPLVADDPFAFRVMPVRYSPYVAIEQPGQKGSFPARFQPGDADRQFWLPIHKLFDGDECIRGLDLDIDLRAHHQNEKLRRLYLYLKENGIYAGWEGRDLDNPPFVFTDGIAELCGEEQFGSGLLVPTRHDHLTEPADYDGKPLSMAIPRNYGSTAPSSEILSRYFSGLYVEPAGPTPPKPEGQTVIPNGESHRAPEILNSRHKVLPDGQEVNLNRFPDIRKVLTQGGYQARHFVDFSGDGWIEASCPHLAVDIPTRVAAYSVVSAPDFFPYCDQSQLMEWWPHVPRSIRSGLWAVVPKALSDQRHAPNVRLKGAGFEIEDQTATAIVCMTGSDSAKQRPAFEPDTPLLSSLADAGAGVFNPGWDVTTDSDSAQDGRGNTDTRFFLTAYGLGSPFVEDAKICAALGTYWPAVAPDATRTFQPSRDWPTVCPLTDEEIGQVGDMPWDGVPGPRRVSQAKSEYVEYTDIDYADYVDNALAGKITAKLTSRVDSREYQSRVLAMAWVYWALGIEFPWHLHNGNPETSYFQKIQTFLQAKAKWSVFSFTKSDSDRRDPRLREAEHESGVELLGDVVYRFEVYRWGRDVQNPKVFWQRWVEVLDEATLYTDLTHVLLRYRDDRWIARKIPKS